MNTEIQQAQQFHANFQMLNRNIEQIQKRNMRMRNFFLIMLLQVFLFSVILNATFI